MLNGVREYTKIKTTMFGLLVLLLCVEFAKAGVLCSTRKMNWQESMNSCTKLSGTPVTIDTKNEDFYKQQLNGNYEVWASRHTYYDDCYNGIVSTVCGYLFIEKSNKIFQAEMRLGDCETNRNYICWSHNSNSFEVLRANYSEAIKCQRSPTVNDLLTMSLPSGYYWKADKWTICQHQDDISNSVNLLNPGTLCRVYDNSDGFFFVNCSTLRHTICEFDQNVNHPEYVECIEGNYWSTNPTQRPSVQVSISTTIEQRYTDKITSTMKPSTSKHSSTVITTMRQTHKDLGIKVGVPVASCVVLLGVVIFVVYMCRRYKGDGGATKRDDCVDGHLRSKSNTNQLQPSNVITVTNETYTYSANDDTVEDEYAYISEADDDGTDQDMNTQSYERCGHFSMGNNAFDNEYSYSSDLHDQCKDEQYDITTDLKRQQNKVSDDYNRIQINKAFDRYGVNESELYDTSATNQSRPHCNLSDDYDHINIKRSDSVDVYDTTRPVGPVNETTGDIYNQLDQNDKDDTYDKTSHQQTLLMRPVVDDDMYA
ncbi:hypothetical protein ACF0H5_009800 [Mactra antiquata]